MKNDSVQSFFQMMIYIVRLFLASVEMVSGVASFEPKLTSSSCLRLTLSSDHSIVYVYTVLPGWFSGSCMLKFLQNPFGLTIMIPLGT